MKSERTIGMEWKVEELKIMNNNFPEQFSATREEKISFVDSFNDGKLSYLLGLIDKFNQDEPGMFKNRHGEVITASLKAWIRRNDTKYDRPLIDNEYDYGKYNLLGCKGYIQYNDCYDKDLVDECFDRQIECLYLKEQKYFREHDEYEILKTKLRKYSNLYFTTFGVALIFCSNSDIYVGDEKRKITINEAKELLSKYEQVDNLIKRLTDETNIN